MENQNNQKLKVEFLCFLKKLADGHYSTEDWVHNVVTHFLDSNLEQARVRLVKESILINGGIWSTVPTPIRKVALELIISLNG